MTGDGRLLFVHAGIDPARSLNEQGDAFWWGASDILELTAPFDGFRRVIRGFDRIAAASSSATSRSRSMAAPGAAGTLLAVAFAADGGTVLERARRR